MADLINTLLHRGAVEASQRGPDWVEKLATKMETTQFQPGVDPFAKAGAQHLVNNKGLIADWTSEALLAAAAYYSMGEENEARNLWLRRGATLDELFDALDSNAQRTQGAIHEREQRWDQVKQFLEDFIQVAGPIAIQLLLVAL